MVWLALAWPRGATRPAGPGVKEPRVANRRPDLGRPAAKITAAVIAAAVTAAPAFGGEHRLQALDEILAVIAPDHFVADAVTEFADPPLSAQRGAPAS